MLEDSFCLDPENERTMRDEQHRILSLLGQPPARLLPEQVAALLNCEPHAVPLLVAAKLLKPLGKPAPNGTKYFSTQEVLALTRDDKWLHRVTQALSEHWRERNARKKDPVPHENEIALPATA